MEISSPTDFVKASPEELLEKLQQGTKKLGCLIIQQYNFVLQNEATFFLKIFQKGTFKQVVKK
jgi:hypothetical protein